MSNSNCNESNGSSNTVGETKPIGGHLDSELVKQFHVACALRSEKKKDALAHALRMYISATEADSQEVVL